MFHPHVVNVEEVEETIEGPEGREFSRKQLGRATGGDKLGCSLYTLEPGDKAWRYHYHTANEEAIFVLDGRGAIRFGENSVEVNEGDYVTLPAGEEGAHQVVNTSEGEFRYLCISTMIEPEMTVYPEANMIGLYAGSAPGGDEDERTVSGYLRADADIDYWNGAA